MASEPRRLDPADMAKIPFLRGLLPAQVEALCAAGAVREFAAGSIVFRQGDPGRQLHVVIAGEIAVELEVPSSSPRLLASLGAGAVFGEINFVLGSLRTATARAVRDSRVIAFDRDAVGRLDGIGRQAAANLLETVAHVLAVRLTHVNRELAAACAGVAEAHPAAAAALGVLDERRSVILHRWDDAR